jgi:hypothetical protein
MSPEEIINEMDITSFTHKVCIGKTYNTPDIKYMPIVKLEEESSNVWQTLNSINYRDDRRKRLICQMEALDKMVMLKKLRK